MSTTDTEPEPEEESLEDHLQALVDDPYDDEVSRFAERFLEGLQERDQS